MEELDILVGTTSLAGAEIARTMRAKSVSRRERFTEASQFG